MMNFTLNNVSYILETENSFSKNRQYIFTSTCTCEYQPKNQGSLSLQVWLSLEWSLTPRTGLNFTTLQRTSKHVTSVGWDVKWCTVSRITTPLAVGTQKTVSQDFEEESRQGNFKTYSF